MRKFFKLFSVSVAGIGSVLCINAAHSATGRGGANVNTARMPTMSVNSINATASPTLPTGNTTAAACTDGGIQNSKYTVEACMEDVLYCVNGGALPNGMNDLFNEDLRNSIFNGMGLCSVQVDKCVNEVRKNCENIYANSSAVWVDFNSRKIQPEYFSFVLRKTGLTPNQAENTCMLLDKNTYGTSFTAVSTNGGVASEYAKNVGAYNAQGGGSLTKGEPQGVQVNQDNYDGQRGHYARWDATQGECLVRVAAYNKGDQITNKWLFGAMGDDENAEVWKAAGSNFTCDKDLFGFSLLNQTKTTALIGVGGGAAVGAGIGAIAGHGKRNFDCSNKSALKELDKQLRESDSVGTLNRYLEQRNKISAVNIVDEKQCNAVLDVYDSYLEGMSIDDPKSIMISPKTMIASVTSQNFRCKDSKANVMASANQTGSNAMVGLNTATATTDSATATVNGVTATAKSGDVVATVSADGAVQNCQNYDYTSVMVDGQMYSVSGNVSSAQKSALKSGSAVNIAYIPEKGTQVSATYKDLQKGFANGSDVVCQVKARDCIDGETFEKQINELDDIFSSLKVLKGEKGNMIPAIAIGAGAGAAAGGLATAITAFVEKNNVSCHVGDGLKSVGFNKSYSIDSLKDFYVKWALNLPDTIMPTSYVDDCESWQTACASLTDLNQCAIAQVNYRPTTSSASQLVNTACRVQGSTCVENDIVTQSYGACNYQ